MSKIIPKQTIARALADYASGVPVIQVAKNYKMSSTTLLKYVRLHNATMRRDPVEINELAIKGMKRCRGGKNGCDQILPISAFGKNATYCKECSAKLMKLNHRSPRGQLYWRERNYSIKFGITTKEYEKMLERQGGCCALCSRRPGHEQKKRLSVDHCHKTGKVRGLLCSKCNCGIGHLQDSPELLRKAAEYIDHYASDNKD